MKYEEEYVALLDLYVRVVESMRGNKLEKDIAWLADTQPLAGKLLAHLGSLFYLTRGTSLPKLADVNISFIDHASVTVVARAAFESYLTFYYVFVASSEVEEKRFRYKLWELGGLLDRQRLPCSSEEHMQILSSEKEMIDSMREEIRETELYKQLPGKVQEKAMEGNWRLSKSWADLAEIARFDRDYFAGIYSYLCSYAHSSNLSVLQIGEAESREAQAALAQVWLGFGLVLMSHFIFAYVSLYPKAGNVLDEFQDEAGVAEIWHGVGLDLTKAKSGMG